MTQPRAAVTCCAISHTYRDDAGSEVTALAAVDLRVERGEAVALIGPSGSGKSTLLTLLAGLVRPTSGTIRVADAEVTAMSERELLRFRALEIGVVLQNPGRNLLPYATASQNIAFAQRRGSGQRAQRQAEVHELLDSVQLGEVAGRSARFLSGGQQQRLALAVALAGRPSLLLADEPTSQLDRRTGESIIELMLSSRENGTTLVLVTHDQQVSNRVDTAYVLHDGKLRVNTRSPVAGDRAATPE